MPLGSIRIGKIDGPETAWCSFIAIVVVTRTWFLVLEPRRASCCRIAFFMQI
jgi:hypothetical protein